MAFCMWTRTGPRNRVLDGKGVIRGLSLQLNSIENDCLEGIVCNSAVIGKTTFCPIGAMVSISNYETKVQVLTTVQNFWKKMHPFVEFLRSVVLSCCNLFIVYSMLQFISYCI